MKSWVSTMGVLMVVSSVPVATADEQGDREREELLERQQVLEEIGFADQNDYNQSLNDIDDREGQRCANSSRNNC
ncbi:hypothetical protein [Oricola cellulosilytica]|uniref:DUF4148 domain-containing protein n=1 Tax=Oricola cellulosilytica TaxID=1429082 RepID=A0A4R0PA29_9HYPH|nr:hypothetical protein [Oricola cellulosilytica]TCD14112.1 hypothetical protein E0D97_08435 [Oricola cellulosilytica]